MQVYSDAARDSEITGLGWEVITRDNHSIDGSRYIVGEFTSMQAEYFALLDGIRYARDHGGDRVEVFTDCKPLIQKMRVPDGNDQEWYDRRRGCHRLLNKFDSWELEWTPRSTNTRADRLAYEALERGRRE